MYILGVRERSDKLVRELVLDDPAPFVPLVNVANVDNVKVHTLNLKGTYKVSPRVDVTGGYAYEKYDYKDAQYDGYQYTIPAASRADSYLMGYYKDPAETAKTFTVPLIDDSDEQVREDRDLAARPVVEAYGAHDGQRERHDRDRSRRCPPRRGRRRRPHG